MHPTRRRHLPLIYCRPGPRGHDVRAFHPGTRGGECPRRGLMVFQGYHSEACLGAIFPRWLNYTSLESKFGCESKFALREQVCFESKYFVAGRCPFVRESVFLSLTGPPSPTRASGTSRRRVDYFIVVCWVRWSREGWGEEETAASFIIHL